MVLSVKHTKVDSIPDGTDPNQVQPSDWNAEHTLSGFGGAAQLNVGTAAGTVAAGNDSRFAIPSNATLTGLASLGSGLGFVVQTALNVFATRTLAAGAGIAISNSAGTAGNPSISVDQAFSPTWTGAHVFGDGAGAESFAISGGAGFDRTINFRTAGTARWGLRATSATESGGNAGSAFAIDAYNDAGVYLSTPLSIARATGLTTLTSLNVTGGIQDNGALLTAKYAQLTANNSFSVAGGNDFTASGSSPTNGVDSFALRVNGSFGGGIGIVNGTINQGIWSQSGPELHFGDGTSLGALTSRIVLSDIALTPTSANTMALGSATKPWASANINAISESGTLLTAKYAQLGVSNPWTAAQAFPSPLTVQSATTAQLIVSGAAGQNRLLEFHTAGVARWKFLANTTAEGGANAGSDLLLNAYDDAGASLGTALSVIRATRAVAIGVSINVPAGGLLISGTDIFNRGNTWLTLQTFTRAGLPVSFTNSSDLNFVGGFEVRGSRSTPTAGDRLVASWYMNNASLVQKEVVRFSAAIMTTTAGVEDGGFNIGLIKAGTTGDYYLFRVTGFLPGLNNTFDLGSASQQWDALYLNAAGGLFFNGTDFFSRANTWTDALQTIVSTSGSPTVLQLRNDAANPSNFGMEIVHNVNTVGAIGYISFRFNNSSSARTTGAYFQANVGTVTAGAESATLTLYTVQAGALPARFTWGLGQYYSAGADPGDGNFNAKTAYWLGGTALRMSHLPTWPTTSVDNTIPRWDGTAGNIQAGTKATIEDTIVLPTNTAITIPVVSGGNGEAVLIIMNERGTATFSGIVHCRPGNPSIDLIAVLGNSTTPGTALPASTVLDASATALTGTTGPAGQLTIRCGVAGTLLSIENRSGANRSFGVFHLGSV